MPKLCVFAGTTEGREIAEFLAGQSADVTVCVATEYGETLLPQGEGLHISARPLPREEMAELFRRERFDLVIDATHPYAQSITKSIASACRETGTLRWRLLRGASGVSPEHTYVETVSDAAAFLSETEGNILLTTGSKELAGFSQLPGFAVLDMELRREGKSYTVDTIRELKAQYAHDELFLMMGTDMFLSFQDWYSPQEIARCAQLVCFSRYDADAENRAALQKQADTLEKLYGQRPVLLTNDCFDISSTEARRLLVFGIAEPYLPQAVLRRIEAQRLYGAGRDYRGLPFDELKTVSLSLHKKTRAAHAIGVCETARQMARQFGADEALAARAGILHDVTKALTGAQQLLLAEKYEVRLTDFERQNRQLLHAKTGAAIARTLFGECEAVCSAITYHTTGKTDMTTLEKIIYLADMIEPNRTYPGVDTIRAAAEESLDGGVLLALERTICYLQEEGFAVCEDSVRARDFLLRERNLTQHEA